MRVQTQENKQGIKSHTDHVIVSECSTKWDDLRRM